MMRVGAKGNSNNTDNSARFSVWVWDKQGEGDAR